MDYLIDSNIVIDFLNLGNIALFPINAKKLYLSVITYIEILYGIQKKKSQKNLADFKNFIRKNQITIIPIGRNLAGEFVKLKLTLEQKGERLEDFDLFIASSAIINNLTLVTGNTKHFQRVKSLKLFDPKISP